MKRQLVKFNNQKGQALLIIVLIMVIALTVGLSIVARTITNIRTTTQQANSQKALAAAEAGIEQGLVNTSNTTPIAGSLNGNTTYSTSIASVSGATSFLVDNGNMLAKDDGSYIWLTSYSSNPAYLWQSPWSGTLTLYWGSPSDVCSPDPTLNTAAAIEIAVISGTRANPVVTRYVYDPCSRSNSFQTPLNSPPPQAGKTFSHYAQITINSGLLIKVMPLYAPTYMAAAGSTVLPFQGTTISSTGTSDFNSSDAVTRTVVVYQGYPELPSELFPYSLFSP